MMSEYPLENQETWQTATFVGTFKAILKGVNPRKELMVAKVEDTWWVCTKNWMFDETQPPLQKLLGDQLETYHDRYISELIVGNPKDGQEDPKP